MKKETLVGAALAAGVTLAVALAVWYFRSPEASFVKPGQMAPELRLPTLGSDGTPTRLSDFRGRPVLLAMFLSACHICENEVGEIERLHRELLPKGLVVLGVALDPDAATTQDFVKRHELTFLVMPDLNGAAVREAYHSWKMPEAYLIDASGRVESVHLGSVKWRDPALRERIQKLLPPPRPARTP
jgi:peroxiredoxin